MDAACDAAAPLGWQRGSVLAVYLHGLFENPAVTRALFGAPGAGSGAADGLEAVFDRLAGHVDAAFAPGALMALLDNRR